MSKFLNVLKVIWHGTSIALDAASALQGMGVLKVGGKAGAALTVAMAIEQAAKGKQSNLLGQ